MKALKMLLKSEGVTTHKLRVLFEQDGAATLALTTDGWDALDLWVQLRNLVPKTGRWPLLVADDYPTNRGRHYSDGKEPAKPHFRTILEEAENIDFAAWLLKSHEAQVKLIRDELEACERNGYEEDAGYFRSLLTGDEEFQGIDRGEWPKKVRAVVFEAIAAETKFTSDMDAKRVTMALLPAPEGWKAAAFMKWGGWNGSPGPALHCAAMRYWEQQYGAEIVAMTSDEWEPRVLRPPQTRKEALRLAKQHFLYCPDRISQGEGALEALAAKLHKADAWYFWWD